MGERSKLRASVILAAAVLVAAFAPSEAAAAAEPTHAAAAAEPTETAAAAKPAAPRTHKVLTGGIDVGVFADRQPEQDVVSISPLLQLGLRPRREVELGLSMGAASLTADSQVDGRVREVRSSNFVFGARWVRDGDARHHRGHLGFSFALPTNRRVEGRGAEALDLALGTRAGLNPWQWLPATMGVVVPGGWSFHRRRLAAGLDAALAGLFSAAGNPDVPRVAAQVRAYASYVHPWATAGFHASAVYNGRDDRDTSQLAVGPLAKLPLCFGERRRPSCPIAAAAQLNLNLDAPYGFAGDGLEIWGMQFGLEWSLAEAE